MDSIKMLESLYRNGKSSLKIIPKPITIFPVAIPFKNFSPLYVEFNEKIDQMISSGIIDNIFRKIYDKKPPTRKVEEIGPQVLTLNHLEICFYAFLTPLLASVTVFFVEIMIGIFRINLRKIVMFFVLKSYMKIKRSELSNA